MAGTPPLMGGTLQHHGRAAPAPPSAPSSPWGCPGRGDTRMPHYPPLNSQPCRKRVGTPAAHTRPGGLTPLSGPSPGRGSALGPLPTNKSPGIPRQSGPLVPPRDQTPTLAHPHVSPLRPPSAHRLPRAPPKPRLGTPIAAPRDPKPPSPSKRRHHPPPAAPASLHPPVPEGPPAPPRMHRPRYRRCPRGSAPPAAPRWPDTPCSSQTRWARTSATAPRASAPGPTAGPRCPVPLRLTSG